MPRGGRRRWIGAALVAVVLLAVALVWFQPQKLFYDDTVDQALPSVAADPPVWAGGTVEADVPAGATSSAPAPPAEPVDLARGEFVSREHETTGIVRVVQLGDGSVFVRLEGFETSNGPALFVYLSQNTADGPDDAFDDDAVDLGSLQGNIGDQNYAVPPGVDPLGFTSVVIWCDRFDASFGVADLQPA